MARGDGKADPWRIISAHLDTLVDLNTGRRRWRDHFAIEGVPIAVATLAAVKHIRISEVASAGLLTVAGLLSAFLFGAMLQVSDRAMSWADTNPMPGPETSTHAAYLRELAANAGYSSLVSITAAVAFVIASTTKGPVLRYASAAGAGLGAHLVLTLLMVMKRVFALTEERLTKARSSGTSAPTDRR